MGLSYRTPWGKDGQRESGDLGTESTASLKGLPPWQEALWRKLMGRCLCAHTCSLRAHSLLGGPSGSVVGNDFSSNQVQAHLPWVLVLCSRALQT